MSRTSQEYPRWEAVARTMDESRRSQVNRSQAVLEEVRAWFKAVRQFREAELSEVVLRDPGPRDLRFHRAYLAQIIAAGEQAAIPVDLNGLPDNTERLGLETIEAELESLYHTQIGYHGGMSPERKEQILQEVFGEPQRPGLRPCCKLGMSLTKPNLRKSRLVESA